MSQATKKAASFQQHTPPTTCAFDPNISAHAVHAEHIAATGVRLAHLEEVIELDIWILHKSYLGMEYSSRLAIISRGIMNYRQKSGEFVLESTRNIQYFEVLTMLMSGGFTSIIAFIIIIFISFPLHEIAHAYTADYFGDTTPRMNGRITLNPLAHIELMGAVLLAIAGFGWAKPVPINEYQLMRRHPQAPMLVALVGPLSNFALAVVGAIVMRGINFAGVVTPMIEVVWEVMGIFVSINLLLMLFNLIPLFPLDGEKVLIHLLPKDMNRPLVEMRRFGSWPLIIVIFVLPRLGIDILGLLIYPPLFWLRDLLIGI